MSESKKKINMFVSVMLIIAIIVMQSAVAFAYNGKITDYLAIQANNFSIGKQTYINGNVIKGGMEDYSSAIFYLISGEKVVTDELNAAENDVIEEPVYCKKNVNINSQTLTNNAIVASDKSIDIKGRQFTSDEIAIIYSNTGNITIKCDEIDFSGIIYAPNGKVTIESDNVIVKGCIIANSVKIDSNNAKIVPNEER